jgi:hypothetical protein
VRTAAAAGLLSPPSMPSAIAVTAPESPVTRLELSTAPATGRRSRPPAWARPERAARPRTGTRHGECGHGKGRHRVRTPAVPAHLSSPVRAARPAGWADVLLVFQDVLRTRSKSLRHGADASQGQEMLSLPSDAAMPRDWCLPGHTRRAGNTCESRVWQPSATPTARKARQIALREGQLGEEQRAAASTREARSKRRPIARRRRGAIAARAPTLRTGSLAMTARVVEVRPILKAQSDSFAYTPESRCGPMSSVTRGSECRRQPRNQPSSIFRHPRPRLRRRTREQILFPPVLRYRARRADRCGSSTAPTRSLRSPPINARRVRRLWTAPPNPLKASRARRASAPSHDAPQDQLDLAARPAVAIGVVGLSAGVHAGSDQDCTFDIDVGRARARRQRRRQRRLRAQ